MIQWKDVDVSACPVAGTLGLIGDRWTMLILRDCLAGVTRFDVLVEHIGIARSTLSDRLDKLVGAGILAEQAYREPGSRPRVEYVLTGRGRDLRHVVAALREWGDRHLLTAEERMLDLVDGTTGARLHLALVDDNGQAVPDDRIRPRAGPGLRRRATG